MTDNIQAFTMPKWGIEMEEGVIREWHADIGTDVNEGEVFVVIETDKIANEVELEYTSTLRWRIEDEGDAYPVGALIAVFAAPEVSDSDIETFRNNFKAVDASFANSGDEIAANEKPAIAAAPEAVIPTDKSISPLAKKLAEELGVDLSAVETGGRRGRISLQDVEQAAKAQGLFNENDSEEAGDTGNPHEVIKLSAMRKTIAKRLSEANQNIPHFYLRSKVNMDALVALRKSNKLGSVNDYIVKACAKALKAEPDVNVHFMGDTIHKFEHADVSVAVATERGLITPIIRAADTKSVSEISAEMKDMAQKAKDEKLQPSDYQGGTFSLSNLGMMGITSFDAVINPPMGAILAVGATEKTPLAGGGEARIMQVTMSCDHRAIDGALGALWLNAFKAALENPESL